MSQHPTLKNYDMRKSPENLLALGMLSALRRGLALALKIPAVGGPAARVLKKIHLLRR